MSRGRLDVRWALALVVAAVVGALVALRFADLGVPDARIGVAALEVRGPQDESAVRPDPPPGPISEPAGARSALETPDAPLRLRLLAWPTSRPLEHCFADVRVGEAVTTLRVGDDGRLECARPASREALVIAVEGFHESRLDSDVMGQGPRHELVLRPLRGLFGRTVDRDGRPVSGATVTATMERHRLDSARADAESASASFSVRSREVGRETSDGEGWFALDVAREDEFGTLRVQGVLDTDHVGELVVALPRADALLDDLVLAPLPNVEVRVVDEQGTPVPGVHIFTYGSIPAPAGIGETRQWTTDANGECSVAESQFPSALVPYGIGLHYVGHRIDGVEVPMTTWVERPGQRIEWTCRIVDVVHLFVRDAVTGVNIVQPNLEVVAYAGAERVAELAWFNAGENGAYNYGFHVPGDEAQVLDRAPAYDRLELTLRESGYEPIEQRVLTRAQLPPGGEYTLALQPRGAGHLVSGRVVDEAGRPLASVSVRAVGVAEGPATLGNARGVGNEWSDAEGRFRLLWSPTVAGLSVVVYGQDARTARFGLLGPLDPTQLQDLELRLIPALRVPFELSSDVPDADLRVSSRPLGFGERLPLFDTALRTRRTSEGKRVGTLDLPAHVRVALHPYVPAEGGRMATSPTDIEFDPASPILPLRLSVARSSIRLSGSVVGPDESRARRCRVVAVQRDAGSNAAKALGTRDADGFTCLVPDDGPWSLLLVDPTPEGGSAVVGRLDLDVVGDLQGLVLAFAGGTAGPSGAENQE